MVFIYKMCKFDTGKWKIWIKLVLNSQKSPNLSTKEFKNFFNLLIYTYMKSIIKGMTLLLAGASFVACSKDVAFDENAQKQAEVN